MIPLPIPPWLAALDRIGPGHGRVALRCREVLRGEDQDVTGALTELAELALGADQALLPHICTVIGALEQLDPDVLLADRLADLYARTDPPPASLAESARAAFRRGMTS